VGDAAGAVSPLTAGGLDPAYAFRRWRPGSSRTIWRQTIRQPCLNTLASFFARALLPPLDATDDKGLNQPSLELACLTLRLPLLNYFASHVFFGRGSFPDVEKPDLRLAHVEADRLWSSNTTETRSTARLLANRRSRKVDCGRPLVCSKLSRYLNVKTGVPTNT
jgi:hypothetical protein